eukprot:gene2691-899_t
MAYVGRDHETCLGTAKQDGVGKTIDIPIIDREEYEKKKSFKVVISEPKLASGESQAHIPDLRDVKDAEMKKIIEAGKPTLGKSTNLNIKFTHNWFMTN